MMMGLAHYTPNMCTWQEERLMLPRETPWNSRFIHLWVAPSRSARMIIEKKWAYRSMLPLHRVRLAGSRG